MKNVIILNNSAKEEMIKADFMLIEKKSDFIFS
jgi:hypothetical protein